MSDLPRFYCKHDDDAVSINDRKLGYSWHIGYLPGSNNEHLQRIVMRAFEQGKKERSREFRDLIGG